MIIIIIIKVEKLDFVSLLMFSGSAKYIHC